jgi:hypothetical protein
MWLEMSSHESVWGKGGLEEDCCGYDCNEEFTLPRIYRASPLDDVRGLSVPLSFVLAPSFKRLRIASLGTSDLLPLAVELCQAFRSYFFEAEPVVLCFTLAADAWRPRESTRSRTLSSILADGLEVMRKGRSKACHFGCPESNI